MYPNRSCALCHLSDQDAMRLTVRHLRLHLDNLEFLKLHPDQVAPEWLYTSGVPPAGRWPDIVQVFHRHEIVKYPMEQFSEYPEFHLRHYSQINPLPVHKLEPPGSEFQPALKCHAADSVDKIQILSRHSRHWLRHVHLQL